MRDDGGQVSAATGGLPGSTRAAASGQVAEDAEHLVGKLSALVTGLAEGNGVAREAITASGTRTDRPMSLVLDIALGWKGETRIHQGMPEVEGSELVGDQEVAVAGIRSRCEALLADPTTAASVAASVEAAPHARFRDLADEFEVTVGRVRRHCIRACDDCRGSGRHACPSCYGSRTLPCPACDDGRQACHCSGGKVARQETVYSGNTRSLVTVYVTCPRCGGTGRTGSCHRCGGTMRVDCGLCSGTGEVDCRTCARTGILTLATTAWITGRPARTALFPEGTPSEFISRFSGLPLPRIHDDQASTALRSVTAADGHVVATFDCEMPDVAVTARFGNVSVQEFHALGRDPTVVVGMPPFLDTLLERAVGGMEAALAARDPAEAARLALDTRAAAAVMATVSGAGAGSPESVSAGYGKALSTGMLERIAVAARRAHAGLGRRSVRRWWLVFGLPSVLAAFAVTALGFSRHLVARFPALGAVLPANLFATGIAADAILALVPVTIVWRMAGRGGRRAVRAVVGTGASRRPRQGRWVTAGIPLALAATVIGLALTRLPDVPAMLPGVPLLGLMPGPLPQAVTGEPPLGWEQDDETTVRQALYGLREYVPDFHGPETVGLFIRRIPVSVRRMHPDWRLAALARAAAHKEFRLLPLACGDMPAPSLSADTREKLSDNDCRRLVAASVAAMDDPGAEKAWRSTDGKRGGRAKASVPTGTECALVDHEVEVGGTAEHVGPDNVCRTGAHWHWVTWDGLRR